MHVTAILQAGVRLGIFDHIAEGNTDAATRWPVTDSETGARAVRRVSPTFVCGRRHAAL